MFEIEYLTDKNDQPKAVVIQTGILSLFSLINKSELEENALRSLS
jgi:hypothetical protein